ncbi:MAG TPA: VWA domain-containing protein [Pyrinomonadaceae bacterium]|nr:VWA domain-containing protein [Pyrinomonadaceae bacterium]
MIVLLFPAANSHAQVKPKPSPTPKVQPKAEDQEPVRVFTEEVRLPVSAMDQFGHYDPTLEIDDVLVLEDGEPQKIRSVRHVPANVLLILDTGGDGNGLGGLSKKTSTTRDVALKLISRLPEGDRIAVLQSSNQAELLQSWTDDVDELTRALTWKMFAGKRSRLFETMAKAAQLLSDQPEGSRHVILVTDGVETPGGKVSLDEALKQVLAASATVHVISYTTFVRQKNDKKQLSLRVEQRPASSDPISANDPTLPPGVTRSPSFGVAITFDPAMRKLRKAYEADTKKSEKWLAALADETGGRIFLPKSTDEMIGEGEEVAREIGAEYVVTYRPTRPLAGAKPGEYRKVEVASRRVGLHLRSRRGYVVPNPQ